MSPSQSLEPAKACWSTAEDIKGKMSETGISYIVKKMYLIYDQYNIYLASINSFREIMFMKSWKHKEHMKM